MPNATRQSIHGGNVLLRAFDTSEQGRANSFFGMGVVLAPALGPSIGGLLVDGGSFDWHAAYQHSGDHYEGVVGTVLELVLNCECSLVAELVLPKHRARVRFSPGPQKTQMSRLRGTLCFVEGAAMFCTGKTASRGRGNSIVTTIELSVTTHAAGHMRVSCVI